VPLCFSSHARPPPGKRARALTPYDAYLFDSYLLAHGDRAAGRPADESLPGVLRSRLLARADVSLGEELGHGAFGIVRQGRYAGTDVAVKLLNLDHVRHTLGYDRRQAVAAFYWEALNLALVDHPGVVTLIGVCVEEDFKAIVLEFCGGRDLSRRQGAPLAIAWRWAVQLAEALRYLHVGGQVGLWETAV
jgi:hypothetical protein